MKALHGKTWLISLATFTLLLQQASGGPLTRVANTSLRMPSSPPTFGYTTANVFPTLTFTNPTTIVSAPGETNRLFVVEKRGRIVVITNLAAPTRTIFTDLSASVLTSAGDTGGGVGEERGLLGMAFHPGYATNGFFYVFYTGNAVTTQGNGMHDILSRFRVSAADPNQGDATSELRFINQFDEAGNHNGGDLHFGQDGYLYVSLGDEGSSYNSFANAQKINKDYFAAIMRLDVDKRPGSVVPNPHPALPSLTNYTIPPNNPYIGATTFNGMAVNPANVRTEFWASGMRNPWRFSFDSVLGTLYLGHVGQDSVEWINIVTNGANCGWSFYEGGRRWTNSLPAGFVLTPRLVEYGHTNGRVCVIGGVVYRGSRISQLYGSYLYADYASGEIWSLRNSGFTVTQNTIITTDPGANITGFGTDPSNGDVLYSAARGGNNSQIKRIIYNTVTNGTPLPPTLADTGAFTNLLSLSSAVDPLNPSPGIVPYEINLPFWSDNAIKSRWFSVPNPSLTVTFNPTGNWTFPTGTVWVKHFNLELTNGVPSSAKRLETRLLVKNAAGLYGVTYRWGNSFTNATLVPEEGLDEAFTIDDGGGILRTQVWHYPSRVECQICHTPEGGFGLGFNTAQLNRDFDYAGAVTNQLAALSDAGYFSGNVTGIHTLRALAHPTNSAVSLEYRVRSYLAANCSQCHVGSGSSRALWDARITTPTAIAGIIDGPLVNDAGNTNSRVITRGSLANSMMFTRISSPGLRMPPLDSNLLDTNAIQLLSAWITNDLPSYQTFADWQLAHFGSTNAASARALADPDADGAINLLEYLTSTDPQLPASKWQIGVQLAGSVAQVVFPQLANRGFEVQGTTNLFNSNSWSPLDLPGNEPFFSISNRTGQVNDPLGSETNKFYRVRVFAP